MKRGSFLKKALTVAALAVAAFLALKWFSDFENDDLKDYDGNRSKYEEQIEND